MATLLSLLALVLVDRSDESSRGMGLFEAIMVYYIGGVGGGAIVGLLPPFASRSRLGAVLVGMVAAIPLVVAMTTLREGPPWRWDMDLLMVVLMGSMLFGTLGGSIMYSVWRGWR